MPFFPQTTEDGKSQGSDLSQVMERMETSGKTTHLWVNNIDMDILVGPQAEHLCNCLIHTDRFCHTTRKDSTEVNAPRRFQVVYRYKTNTVRLSWKTNFGLKSQVCLNHTSHYSNKSRFRTNFPFSVRILNRTLLNRQSIDFLLKLKYTH